MTSITPEDAAARMGEIDQELAVLKGGSPGRTALDATRKDLEVWKDFLGSTAKDLKGAKKQIGESIEGAKDGTLVPGPQLTSQEVAEHIAGLGAQDSEIDKWISSGQKAAEGLSREFSDAGDVTPESLDGEIEEFTKSVNEVMDGLTKSAAGTSSSLKELLERDDVKQHIDQLQGGVAAGADFANGINDGVKKVDGILENIQTLDDLTSGDAQTQLNAAADAFDELVGLFGDSITMIPGLGAFLSLYGKAFRGAATSAGVIQGIADRNNKIFQMVDPGTYLWMTDEALRANRIRDLEQERSDLLDAGLAAATAERLARDPANYQGTALDRDIAVEMGIRSANDARPDINSAAYTNWVASSRSRDAARDKFEMERVNLNAAHEDLSRAEIATERPPGTSDAARDAANLSTATSRVETAQKKFDAAGAEYDAALEAHTETTAAHRAEIDTYNDAVRQGVIGKAAGTHSGEGFSDTDWDWFNSTYPQWRITPQDLAPAPAPSPLSAVPTGISTVATPTSAGTGRNRAVMIAGGGILGIALALGGFFVFRSDDSATPVLTQPAAAAPVTSTSSSTLPPAEEPTSSTSSTSSSTLPPAEETTASFNLIGAPSDVTCEDPNNTLAPALTIAGATFVQEGDEIVVTVIFEGSAEAYEAATTDTFPVAVQFRLKEGGPYPEAFFGDKGKLKVSGGLLQIVSHKFSGDTLTIHLKGRTLDEVHAVQVSTFVFAGGTCHDLLFSDGYND